MHNTEEDGCRNRGAEGVITPQIFTDQLTLSQRGGTKLSPPLAPPPRFLDLPMALHNTEEDPYLLELVRILTQKKKDIFHT